MINDDTTIDLLQIKIEKAKRDLPIDTINAIAAVDWKAAILGMRSKYGYTFEQLGDLEIETELLLCGLLPPEDYPKELASQMGIPRAQADELVKEMNEAVFKKIREELIKNTERKKVFAEREREDKVITKKLDEVKPISTPIIQSAPAPIKVPIKSIRETLPIPGVRTEIIQPDVEKIEAKPISVPIKPAPAPVIVKVVSERPASAPVSPPEPKIDIGKPVTPPPFIEEKVKTIEPILAQKLSGAVQIPKTETSHSLDNISKGTPATSYPKGADPYRISPDE